MSDQTSIQICIFIAFACFGCCAKTGCVREGVEEKSDFFVSCPIYLLQKCYKENVRYLHLGVIFFSNSRMIEFFIRLARRLHLIISNPSGPFYSK